MLTASFLVKMHKASLMNSFHTWEDWNIFSFANIYTLIHIIKKQKCDFFENNSQLLFHFNHLVSFKCAFLSRVHEKVFVFPPLLTSWVPTFSFLPLIWRKFNVLPLSAIPAGNLRLLDKRSFLSTQAMHQVPPQTQIYTHTHKHCGVQ